MARRWSSAMERSAHSRLLAYAVPRLSTFHAVCCAQLTRIKAFTPKGDSWPQLKL